MGHLIITGVEAIPLPTGAKDFRISEGKTRRHVSALLRVATDDPSVSGVAEVVSAPPGKPEEFLEEMVGAIRGYVAPALLGMPAMNRRAACARADATLKGRPWTKAVVATVQAGFTTLKLKIGDTVESDVDGVRAVREAVGNAVDLRVDGNDHYLPAGAIRFIGSSSGFVSSTSSSRWRALTCSVSPGFATA